MSESTVGKRVGTPLDQASQNAATASAQPQLATPRSMSDADRWTQLANAVGARNSEDSVLWAAFGIFWAANAILLVALFSTGKLPENELIAPVIAAVGAVMSVIWHGIQLRALGHIERLEGLVKNLEDDLRIPRDRRINAPLPDDDAHRGLRRPIPARDIMRWSSKSTAILWLVATIAFVLSI